MKKIKMKNLYNTIIILTSFCTLFFIDCTGQKVEETLAYFKTLQTKKVLSDSIVSWHQFGSGSLGYCEIVEYHPTNPNYVFMSPDMYNNYGSWDNGATWQTINECDGTSLGINRIRDITFSTQKPYYGLAIDERGWLWKTNDFGHSWVRINNFPAKGVCSVVTFDPSNDKIIYVGSGNFWNVKWNKRTYKSPRREIQSVKNFDIIMNCFDITIQDIYSDTKNFQESGKFHPLHYSRTDYSRVSKTEYGKVWRSEDNGHSWELINSGIPKLADIGKILFHPLDSKILYMATNYGLFKSENRGTEWTNIGINLPHNMLRDLGVYYDKKINKVVLVVIDQVFWEDNQEGGIISTGGVYKSINEGEKWESLNGNLYLDLTKISADVVNSYYSAISSWFDLSNGEVREKFSELPTKALQNFNRLLIDPSNPDRIYLGHNALHDISFFAGDLWKTENGGKDWIVCNRVGTHWQGADREFWENRGNPINQNMKFAHLQRAAIESPYGNRLGCRALTINSCGELIAVMQQQTLQSKDHGESWQQIDAVETNSESGCWIGTGCSNLTRPTYYFDDRLPGRYFLLCGEHGLWETCDFGNATRPPAIKQIVGQAIDDNDPVSIGTFVIHPNDTNIWYMQMYRQQHSGYVRRTNDGGKTWENISKPINFSITVATDRVKTNSMVIERDNPNNMFFCVPSWDVLTNKKQASGFNNFGVYHSSDAGITWKRVNNGLPAEANVTQLCFDPSDHQTLYAAVLQSTDMKTNGGLFRTYNRGEIWMAVPIPNEIKSVNHVCIDKRTKDIYISCGLSYGDSTDGGVWLSRDNGQTWEKIFHMPNVFKTTVSPHDSNRIAVSVGENTTINNLNSGIYLSLDGSKSWYKSNLGLGQAYWVTDLRFDLKSPNVIWCGLNGSGWYKGIIEE